MTRVRSVVAGVCAVVGIGLAGAAGAAHAGGRRPYGGTVEVPVRDFGAAIDPHLARGRDGRLVASLAHCHVFRLEEGRVVPEAAQGNGSFANGVLTVTLQDGARFHDGSPVMASDVVASWSRLGDLREADGGAIGGLAAAVRASEAGPRAVAFTGPRGVLLEELRALLARPEAAILKGGRPVLGGGCGAFRPRVPFEGDRRMLDAFVGHAEGRPWLGGVRLRRVPSAAAEEAAFRYGEVDIGFVAPTLVPAGATQRPLGWSTYFAVLRPRLRGIEVVGTRRAIAGLARDARLGRYVEGRAESAEGPWPAPLVPGAPGTRRYPATSGARAGAVDGFVIGYAPTGVSEGDAQELARALRDTVRPLAGEAVRVVAVAGGLDAMTAARAAAPEWDAAIVRWDWGALTEAQAAWELAQALDLRGLAAADVLTGRVAGFAEAVASEVRALALVHVPNALWVGASVHGVQRAGVLPDLANAWRSKR